ncbi:MAG: methyltransferase domain-containing protein [Kiloniellales bacterium]|jgi:SAM-dependent methyltransferase|nr:methyltransferase domain-containing protein [Kiloniellales bacterium]
MVQSRQYSDAVLANMQSLYGKGFLSPGGAAEVFDIVDGVPIAGREVLDLGCGVGGASLVLAGQLGAARVLGLDVEPASLARAASLVDEAGLAGRVAFELATPGPLPLPDAAFDVVFTKDVVCHLPDKPALFAEAYRVLRPGGVFACADWMRGAAPSADFEDWAARLAASGLVFHWEALEAYRAGLSGAGFAPIEARDHSAWSERDGRRQLAQSERDAAALRRALGDDGYRGRVALTRARVGALADGGLRHVHIRAYRPA